MEENKEYNILVVEDEKIIREGIAESLADAPHFSVMTAANGELGMAVLDSEKIHGIVLDIKMPRIDGLELLEWIRDRNLGAAVFVLSGYDDFEYVQRALKAGADDYLLKPATPEKVKEISKRLLEKILEKEKMFADWQEMERKVKESKKFLKDRFFHDLIESPPDEQTWKDQTEYLGMHCADLSKAYAAAVLEIDREEIRRKYSKREQVYQVIIQKIESVIGEICDSHSIDWFHLKNAEFVLFFSGDSNTDITETLRKELEEILSVRFTAGIGNPLSGIRGIVESYRQAVYALQFKIVLGKYGIYQFCDLIPEPSRTATRIDAERFELYIRTGRVEEAKAMIAETLGQYGKTPNSGGLVPLYTECLMFISRLFSAIGGVVYPSGDIQTSISFGNLRGIVDRVFELDSIRRIQEYLFDLAESAGKSIEADKRDRHGSIVEGIKKIIREKYAEDLDNRKIAVEMGISPNYAGQVFRKETGKTIKGYLSLTRVEAAKKLLKNSHLMIYEIAYQTGFKDEHYFSFVFKGETGMSPSEYREL